MAVRRTLTLVDSTGINHIQELTDAQTNDVATKYAQYVYNSYPATTLSVVGSGGNLPGQPMTDTRYQAGTYTTRVDRFATEAETANISTVTVNYSRIQQTTFSGTEPADTNNLRWPLYLYSTGPADTDLHFRTMSSTDFYDTFVAPALTTIQASTPGDYFISTSTSVGGASLVSATPVFTDTRADTTAYTSGGIPEAQDQPVTINNYYLHQYSASLPTDDGDLPIYFDANIEQIRHHSLSSWAALLGPWLQYYMVQTSNAPQYSINGLGLVQGTAMTNTILQPSGTGYTTRFVNANDYRTQEFPNGTPIVSNTYELKKYVPSATINTGAFEGTLTYNLNSTGTVSLAASAPVSLPYSLLSEGDVLIEGTTTASLPYTLSSEGEVVTVAITGTASGTISYSLASAGELEAILLNTLDNPNAYDTSAGDFFGLYVAIFGNRAIVGAREEDDAGGVASGKAYIFNSANGQLLHTLDNPNAYDTSAGDEFGHAVAISENYAIVGAWEEDDASGVGSGKAYIFHVANGALMHTLDNPNAYSTSQADGFGTRVAMTDDYAIVGAPEEDEALGSGSGKAYIFHVANGALMHTLDNPNAYGTPTSDFFGNSVAITNNYAIVGVASEDDAGGSSSGKAYIFHVANGALMHTLDNPNAYDTSAGDAFGVSVAMTDDYAIVGAWLEDDAGGTSSGKAYIYSVSDGTLLHTLDNPNAYSTSASDNFGRSVSISGIYAVVGASLEDDQSGSSSGKAYVFNVVTGELVYTIHNPNPFSTSTSDFFGLPVSISGNRIISGAYQEDDAGGSGSGKAYIFEIPIEVTLETTISNPNAYDTSNNDYFSQETISISGNYAIVGAPAEDDGGNSSGTAYIFHVANGALAHTLDNPNAYDTSNNDFFGTNVAISGNYAIVGAYGEDDSGGNTSGKAYIFHVANGALAHTLDNPNAYLPSAFDYFAWSVDIDSNYAIVGAYAEDDAGGSASGKAYIFHVANGALAHTLDNPNAYSTSSGDRFGYSVAISGNYAIVGAREEDDAGGSASGKAYIFHVANGALAHTLDNPNAYSTSAFDYFGHSVDISGNYAIVGAYGEDDAGGGLSGKAYIFNVTTGALLRTLDNPNDYGTSDSDNFGFRVAISGNYAIVGAYGEDDAGGGLSGKAYLFDVTNGDLLETIDNPNDYGTSASDYFGRSVAISGNYIIVGARYEDDASGTDSGIAYIYKIT